MKMNFARRWVQSSVALTAADFDRPKCATCGKAIPDDRQVRPRQSGDRFCSTRCGAAGAYLRRKGQALNGTYVIKRKGW